MYSVPLRRALVTDSDLPYPEGVAAAEVLKVGAGERRDQPRKEPAGLIALIAGSIASAGFAVIVAMRVFAAELDGYFRVGTPAHRARISHYRSRSSAPDT